MQALIGPARETVLLTPASSKINCIEQKVKKKIDGVITLYCIKILYFKAFEHDNFNSSPVRFFP
jgi:hypothetical protein